MGADKMQYNDEVHGGNNAHGVDEAFLGPWTCKE